MQNSKLKVKSCSLKYKVLLFAFLIITFDFALLTLDLSKAHAQTFSLSVYPPLLEVMIMPGKSITQAYQITNLGDKTAVNSQVVAFEPADELGNISLRGLTSYEVRPPQTPQSWFNFENADIALGQPFTLNPGQPQQIVLKIKIPEDAREDDYYSTLLFSTKPQGVIPGSGAQQAGIIGANILITVSRDGKPVKKGEIEEFTLLNCYIVKLFNFCLIDSFDQPKFLLRIKNTGRTFWKPFGKIKTEGLLRQNWEREILPDNVLADSIRQIQIATESASPAFLIGPFRAKAEFSLEEDGPSQTRSANTFFLALPIKALTGLLTAVVILFIFKSTLRKSQGKVYKK